ncbi:hypothetical protein FRC12_012228, partial [Ceratobasidium sp. 428]
MSGYKRSVNTIQLPQLQRAKLMKNGYTTVADILAVSATELASDLGLPLADATVIIAAANPATESQALPSESTALSFA